MNIKYLPLALLLAGATAFSQKKEIKQAESAVENQQYSQAKQILSEVSQDEVNGLNKKFQSRYYSAYGIATGLGGDGSIDQLTAASESLKKAKELGDKDADQGLEMVKQYLLQSAFNDQEEENFKDASAKFYNAYQTNPQDTVYLFAAANNAYNAQDDENALAYYEKLKDIGYKGNTTVYSATNTETGEVENFNSSEDRELFLKTGQYKDPKEQEQERQDGNIVRQIAFTYLRMGDEKKAMNAIQDAKKLNPDDPELVKAEALFYEKNGDTEKYKQVLEELIQKDPENSGIYYVILGDNALKKEENDVAEEYYKKAIESDDKSVAANNGMANIYLNEQEAIVDEMNDLGMSAADNKKYDELSKKRTELLNKALPFMEKAHKYEPDNQALIQTLYQINSQLRNKEEAAKYKELLDAQ